MKVTLADIEAAAKLISDTVLESPTEYSKNASELLGTEVYFKYENRQKTGSFKIRGALNRMRHLSEDEKKRGVVASSAGNHAQGVAASATACGVQSHIVMPQNSVIVKQIATRGYGAHVILHGDLYDEAYEHARVLEKEHDYIFIPPFENPHIIAGQGTVALELLKQAPNLESVVVPIGGGGLISGMAIAIKSINPSCKVYGCVAGNAPAMRSLFYKEEAPKGLSYLSIADGISIKKPSSVMYENFISKYVDDIVAVSEDDIAAAVVFLLERTKTVVEGSGAITFAAMRSGQLDLGKKTAAVLSGGNIDMNLVSKIIERGLSSAGRLGHISVIIDDRPGALYEISGIIAEHGANVLDVKHDRVSPDLRIRETRITFMLEARNNEHIKSIALEIQSRGIKQVSY